MICLVCARETGRPCSVRREVFSHSSPDIELSLVFKLFQIFPEDSPCDRDAKVYLLASAFLHKVSLFWVPSP